MRGIMELSKCDNAWTNTYTEPFQLFGWVLQVAQCNQTTSKPISSYSSCEASSLTDKSQSSTKKGYVNCFLKKFLKSLQSPKIKDSLHWTFVLKPWKIIVFNVLGGVAKTIRSVDFSYVFHIRFFPTPTPNLTPRTSPLHSTQQIPTKNPTYSPFQYPNLNLVPLVVKTHSTSPKIHLQSPNSQFIHILSTH